MKLFSWNVNGIRACVNKGFLDFLDRESPDIIGLQEVKAMSDQNPISRELSDRGYHIFWNAAQRPGYSGTAVFSRSAPIRHFFGMNEHMDDIEGRITTVEYEDFYFVTVYTPNSKSELERLEYRQLWDEKFAGFLKALESHKPVTVCGDLNVAHKEIDLTHPKANLRSAGYTTEERAGLTRFFDNGLVDSFRHFYPDLAHQYTWWSNFSNARAKNVGWRIDYFLVSERLKSRLVDAKIYPHILGSDHCPVSITLS